MISRSRAITRDESLYPEPNVFRPDRFMVPVDKEAERRRDPRSYVFGFGRRFVMFFPQKKATTGLMILI